VSELRALCEAARALRQARQPALLVTLVAARGSSYRRPGARLLIASPDATPITQCGLPGLAGLTGSVSGGCVERDLALRGWWRLADGQPTLVSYDSGDDDELGWRLGAGCGGTLDLLLERFDPNGPPAVVDPLDFIDDCVAAQQRGVMLTVCRSRRPDVPVGARLAARESRDVVAPPSLLATSVGAALAGAAHQALAAAAGPTRVLAFAGGAVEALIETVQPPPHLFLCGCGRDAVPVATLARSLGWTVSVWTPRPRFELGARFSRLADHLHTGAAAVLAGPVNAAACALAVVMTHNLNDDRAALSALLPSRARYIGVLGPRRRTRQLLGELPHPQIPALAGSAARLYAPVGLAIGAETPGEIALSIIGEAQAVLAGVSAAHLRDQENIHDPAPTADARGVRR
jgi:xanthine dehydrogenase accessory factor